MKIEIGLARDHDARNVLEGVCPLDGGQLRPIQAEDEGPVAVESECVSCGSRWRAESIPGPSVAATISGEWIE